MHTYCGKLVSVLCLGLFSLLPIHADEVIIKISNPTIKQQREVVEIDARMIFQRLKVDYGTSLVVRNDYGQQIASQLTSDSLLLIEAAVRPMGQMVYKVSVGSSMPVKSYVDGRLYAWRLDDFTWENDLTAYRAYGPALQQTGEKAYGIDVWLKSVPEPVVASRYEKVFRANQIEREYRNHGRIEEADSVKRENSLHLDHGNGLDCYNVGPSLGCGTPALMVDDSIVMPYCYARYRLLDNGPLRFMVEFTYHPIHVDGQEDIVEHRLISLDKGSYFNKMIVWYEHLRRPMKFCSGVVIHSDDTTNIRLGKHFVQYADPTDNPTKHNFQIYVATLFPEGTENTYIQQYDAPRNGIAGHALGIATIHPGEYMTYFFGAGWTKNGIRNQDMWQQEIDDFLFYHKHPLCITLE